MMPRPDAQGGEIEVRALAVRDSLATLTAMLRRAYAPLAAQGLNVTAATQDEEMTRQRALEGQCMVAVLGQRIVGTITVSTPLDQLSGIRSHQVALYREADTGHFHQFAVEPDLRQRGIGQALLREAERWARSRGYRSMAVDAPESAAELVEFFRHQGYRQVGSLQWPGKTYRSVVLRKVLDRSPLHQHLLTVARHAQWALAQLLGPIGALSEADYRRDLGLHHGSIHATLNHLLAVEQRFWWPRLREDGQPQGDVDLRREWLEDRVALAQALRAARAQWIELLESWSEDRLLGEVEFTSAGGQQVVLPLASLLAHVFDHAALHRGEIVAALVQLGLPAPEVGLANMLRDEAKGTRKEARTP